MSARHKALLSIVLVALLWGSAGTVGKLLIRQAHPLTVVLYRFGAAALVMLPFFLAAKKPKRWYITLFPLSFFNGINVLLFFSGLARSTANTGSLLGAGVPLMTALLSWILIKEHISKSKLLGIIVGLIGAILIVLVPILETSTALGTDLIGNLYFLGSALAWSLYITGSRSSAIGDTYNVAVATFFNFFICSLMALIACIATGQSLRLPALAIPSYLGLFVFSVIGVTVITFFLFQWALQYISASTASLKEYLQLIISVAINSVVLGERITPVFLLGSLLIICGVTITTGERISKKIISVLTSRTP